MKAIVMERYGPPERLELRDVPVPTPKPNEVLVRVHAASVNDWDYSMVIGKPFLTRVITGLRRPRVRSVGGDIAGRVEAVGSAVTSLKTGDEVYGDLCEQGFGAFAEYVCAPDSCLVHKPTAMTFEHAASIPQAGMLAVQGLIDVGRLQRGQTLLLNGAGGGVGTIALQIAKHVKRGGAYVTVGGDTSRPLQLALPGLLISRLSDKRLTLAALKPNKDLPFINDLYSAGKFVPVIDSVYPLARVPDALARFGTGEHHGKIIITMT